MNIVELFISKNLKISTAESCTGGMVAGHITSISGASECFDMGVVTYSNEAKTKLLSVKKETLDEFGAVSEETARQMCDGVRNLANSNIGISVTGIAGPNGGTVDKPVGLVYIGVSGEFGTNIKKLNLKGSREDVIKQTVDAVLQMITEYLVQFYS